MAAVSSARARRVLCKFQTCRARLSRSTSRRGSRLDARRRWRRRVGARGGGRALDRRRGADPVPRAPLGDAHGRDATARERGRAARLDRRAGRRGDQRVGHRAGARVPARPARAARGGARTVVPGARGAAGDGVPRHRRATSPGSSLSSDLHTLPAADRDPAPPGRRVARAAARARRWSPGSRACSTRACCCSTAPSAGAVPDAERVRRRVAEREFEEDGWHVVTVPIPPSGWLAVAARRRVPPARAAAATAVPLLAATERLAELAREQERAVRAALLDELLELAPGARRAAWPPAPPRSASTFPARVVLGEQGRLATRHNGRWVALVDDDGPVAVAIEDVGGVPRVLPRRRPRARARARVLPGVRPAGASAGRRGPRARRPRVDAPLDPLPRRVLDALKEFFARDQDVNAAAAALHVHPNTLRYRLGRVEALLGRSLRSPRRSPSSCSRCRHELLDVWGGDAHDDHRQRAGGHNEVPVSSQTSHVVLQGDTRVIGITLGNPKIRQCGEPHQSSPVPRRGATC